ncbi:hypothetical protein ACO0LB_12155 [Undibacterium sp. SXout7W]|uniref:oxidoreductase n=1 Tax=Undibacterium sp. SXout7W TaxID=3413049 RepID=UPI003BF3B817
MFKAVPRKCFKGTFTLAGGFNRTSSETALSDGQADLIAFGRPFICNPDLLERMKVDVPMNDLIWEVLHVGRNRLY